MAIAEDIPTSCIRDVSDDCVDSLRDWPVQQLASSLELLDVHYHHIACSCHTHIEDAVILCQHRFV